VSRYWEQKAWIEIALDRAHWAKLFGAKLFMVFTNTELADSDVHDRFVVWSPLLNALDRVWGFGGLFALACAGVVTLWSERRRHWPIGAMAVVYALSLAMFFIFARYRMMLVALLMPFAAAAVGQGGELIRRPRRLVPAIVAAGVAIGIVWLGERSIPQRIKGTNDYNRAITAASRGQTDRAIGLYRSAIAQNTTLSAAYQNLGLVLIESGRLEESADALASGVRLEPSDPVAHINFGTALARLGRLEEAITQFEQALHLDATSTAARYNLGAALLAAGRRREGIDVLRPIASATSADPFARRAHSLIGATTTPSTQTDH
jgi:tetratricopeptide (TPR) repeat protein